MPLQPLWPLETFGPLQLVLALEPIVVITTTTDTREMFVITPIKSLQTLMITTANAVISAIMCTTEIMANTANLILTATIAIATNKVKLIDVEAITLHPLFPLEHMVITCITGISADKKKGCTEEATKKSLQPVLIVLNPLRPGDLDLGKFPGGGA